MVGAGFTVTKGARRITRLGGRLTRADKASANRRARRHVRQRMHARGVDAELAPKLWTERQVL
jgi:hypothetical protein